MKIKVKTQLLMLVVGIAQKGIHTRTWVPTMMREQ